jgi:hypothetical protein
LLPGYAYFRYPAKWFVVAALGCSLLAARGVDQILAGNHQARRLAKWMCIANAAAILFLIAGRGQLVASFQGLTVSDLFGPLDAQGAWLDVFLGALQAVIGSALAWYLLSRESKQRTDYTAAGLLLLTAVDLLLANQWLIATIPGSEMKPRSRTAQWLADAVPRDASQPPPRILHAESGPESPPAWREQSHSGRLGEVVAWETDTLSYRHHLRFGINTLDAPTTVRSVEWLAFLRAARRTPADADADSSRTDFDWLGMDAWISRSGTERIRNKSAWPRVWLETARASVPGSGTTAHDAGACRILRYEPQRVEIAVTLSRPATLVLSDAYDPNWAASRVAWDSVPSRSAGLGMKSQATVTGRSQPDSPVEIPLTTAKVRGLVRGVDLPAGEHLVVFRYRPRSFYWGAAISLLAIGGIGAYWLPPVFRRSASAAGR